LSEKKLVFSKEKAIGIVAKLTIILKQNYFVFIVSTIFIF